MKKADLSPKNKINKKKKNHPTKNKINKKKKNYPTKRKKLLILNYFLAM